MTAKRAGKTALATGGAGEIGLACAKARTESGEWRHPPRLPRSQYSLLRQSPNTWLVRHLNVEGGNILS